MEPIGSPSTRRTPMEYPRCNTRKSSSLWCTTRPRKQLKYEQTQVRSLTLYNHLRGLGMMRHGADVLYDANHLSVSAYLPLTFLRS
jgi:hypothetical protein